MNEEMDKQKGPRQTKERIHAKLGWAEWSCLFWAEGWGRIGRQAWISEICRCCWNKCYPNESAGSWLWHRDPAFPDSSACHSSKLLWHFIRHNRLISSLCFAVPAVIHPTPSLYPSIGIGSLGCSPRVPFTIYSWRNMPSFWRDWPLGRHIH